MVYDVDNRKAARRDRHQARQLDSATRARSPVTPPAQARLDDADNSNALIDPIPPTSDSSVANHTHQLLPGALQHHAGRDIIPSTDTLSAIRR